jgi:tetratricopeptide (TPR) repeat protein
MANLIDPDSPAEPARLVQFAEQAVADQKLPYRMKCLGMAYYRAGRYDEAIRTINASLGSPPGADRVRELSFLAMAHFKLGETDVALAKLDEAARVTDSHYEAALASEVGTFPISWWSVLQSQAQYREAHRLIKGTEPADDARRSVLRARALDAVGRGTEVVMPAIAEGVRRIKEPVKLPKSRAVP